MSNELLVEGIETNVCDSSENIENSGIFNIPIRKQKIILYENAPNAVCPRCGEDGYFPDKHLDNPECICACTSCCQNLFGMIRKEKQ